MPDPKKKTSAAKAPKRAAAKPSTAKKPTSMKTAQKKSAPLKNTSTKAALAVRPRKTIAERTVAFKTRNWGAILPWCAVGLLLLMAVFLRFCLVGYSFSALVCICLAGVITFYMVIPFAEKRWRIAAKVLKNIFTIILCIGLLVVGATEALVIRASFGSPEEPFEYLVVLGAGVHGDVPSLSLQNRIDAAYDYLISHPGVTAVLSGGKGDGENISEAQCMYDHLTARGIPANRLWREEEAASTWANMHYSLDLIESRTGSRPLKLGVLSSEYHLLRASLFTKACGAEFVGIPAKTSKISLRINYFMREVAGIWHYILLGGRYE